MKKIILIISLLFLSGCNKNTILNTVYISSIGIDYVEEEYVCYFYSPPSKDIGKNNDTNEATVYVVKNKELAYCFNEMFNSAPTNVNMLHLKTMILSDSFKDINVLLDYFKYSTKVSYNFHVFITNDKLEEIYKYKSMSNISNLYNFLNSPSLIDYEEYGISKSYFLSFANNYLTEGRYNMVPLVKIEKTSLNEEEFQLKIKGYSNIEYIYEGKYYLSSGAKEVSFNNNISLLVNYKVNYKIIDNIYNINIDFTEVEVSGDLDIKSYLDQEIRSYLNKVIFNENELFFIKQYNYLFNQNLDTTNYILNITM